MINVGTYLKLRLKNTIIFVVLLAVLYFLNSIFSEYYIIKFILHEVLFVLSVIFLVAIIYTVADFLLKHKQGESIKALSIKTFILTILIPPLAAVVIHFIKSVVVGDFFTDSVTVELIFEYLATTLYFIFTIVWFIYVSWKNNKKIVDKRHKKIFITTIIVAIITWIILYYFRLV
jgi:hypothetical protein